MVNQDQDKSKVILVGGGGHCKSVIDVIHSDSRYEIHGILDLPEKVGEIINGYKIIGTDDNIVDYVNQGYQFLVTSGQIEDSSLRKKLFLLIHQHGGKFANPIASTATVSKYAKIGTGTIVMHNAQVNTNAKIGDNNIINSGALLEHDVQVGNHCHVSTHTVLNGEVVVGNEVFIGSNAVVLNGISVSNNVTIGAGSVLINDALDKFGIYVGNPSKLIRVQND